MPAVFDYLYGLPLKQSDADIVAQNIIADEITCELYQCFGLVNTNQIEVKLQPVLLQKLAPNESHPEAGEEPFYELSITLPPENITGVRNPKTYADTVAFFLMKLSTRAEHSSFELEPVQLIVSGQTPADILAKLGYKDYTAAQIAEEIPELDITAQIVSRPRLTLVSSNSKPIKPAP